MKHDVKDQDEK